MLDKSSELIRTPDFLSTRLPFFYFGGGQMRTDVYILGAKFMHKLGRAVSRLEELGEEIRRHFCRAKDR